MGAPRIMKLEVGREREIVTLTVRCINEYDAMLFYDEIVASAATGNITIEFDKPTVAEDQTPLRSGA